MREDAALAASKRRMCMHTAFGAGALLGMIGGKRRRAAAPFRHTTQDLPPQVVTSVLFDSFCWPVYSTDPQLSTHEFT